MVSLRSTTSPAPHRSSSRTNTPEPDVPVVRRPVRTYGTANSRRKSSRLSQNPDSDRVSDAVKEQDSTRDTRRTRRTSSRLGSAEDETEPKLDSDMTHEPERDSPVVEPVVEEEVAMTKQFDPAIEGAAGVDGESEETAVVSVGSSHGSNQPGGIANAEEDEDMTAPRKRRRSNKPIVDLSTEEEEEEEEVEDKIAKVSAVEKSPPKKRRGPVKPAKPASKAQSKKASAKALSSTAHPSKGDFDKQELSGSSDEVATASNLEQQPLEAVSTAQNGVESESSSRTRRKRIGSPLVTKPIKRQKAATEAQLRKKLQQESVTDLHCFQVTVFGDANASVKVRIPARLQNARYSTTPDLVSMHPYSVIRSSTTDPTKPKATFAAYRFPLPDRRRHESFEKIQIEVYGKKVKGPTGRGDFAMKEFETGQVTWTLEADEDRCRWMKG
ncbi:hypothetical protein JCM11491_001267 [Sporobolomyces phaffii]